VHAACECRSAASPATLGPYPFNPCEPLKSFFCETHTCLTLN